MTKGKRLLQRIRPYAVIMRGLSHSYRLAIVYLLANKPMTGEQLVRALKMKDNLLMHHLNAMRKADIIIRTREGRHQRYSLKEKTFRALPGIVADTPFWKRLKTRV